MGSGGWWWWGCGDGEEGAFVGFGVADEGGDVWVGKEGVGEDFRWGETGGRLEKGGRGGGFPALFTLGEGGDVREVVYAFAGEGDLGEVG